MTAPHPRIGIALSFVCLGLLGVMPVVADSRPDGADALVFATLLSAWQVLFALPLMGRGLMGADKGILGAHLTPRLRRRTIAIILATGAIFGLSTFLYVLAVEKAGAVSAAIAIQAYPLFAILWETVLLKRRKTALELAFTLVLVTALVYLATGGTGRLAGISPWFLAALGVPFLWSIAHVIIKEVLDRTPITPAQVTFFRVLVSTLILGAALLTLADPGEMLAVAGRADIQIHAAAMGLVYYLELIVWFHAVRHIAVSVASSITVPWPAVTMVLAVPVLGEPVEPHQMIALAVVAASLYGLLYAGARARRQAAAAAA